MKYALNIIAMLCALCAILSKPSFADTFASTVSLGIGDAITITELDTMAFGTVLADPAGGIIRVRPNGNIQIISNSSTHLGGASGARFRVDGSPNSTVNVSFSTGDVLTGPGVDIPLDNFVSNRGASFTLNGSGRRNFRVGADITLNPGQLTGTYTGTYTVTVDY